MTVIQKNILNVTGFDSKFESILQTSEWVKLQKNSTFVDVY